MTLLYSDNPSWTYTMTRRFRTGGSVGNRSNSTSGMSSEDRTNDSEYESFCNCSEGILKIFSALDLLCFDITVISII